MKIIKAEFGETKTGEKVHIFMLLNQQGAHVDLLDYGCTIQKIVVPDKDGKMTDVVLGYETIGEYEGNAGYLGAIVGRCANRIAKGKFSVDGVSYQVAVNNGENHLHGGLRGFDKHIWEAESTPDRLVFKRVSGDGEENYPGNLKVEIAYSFNDDNELKIEYKAVCDKDTVVNLTNHAYFNLNGIESGNVLRHTLQIAADAYLPTDGGSIPTGEIRPVEDTPFDFRMPKTIGRDIESQDEQLILAKGYDHTFVLNGTGMKKFAKAKGDLSGIVLTAYTTQPGVQLYTANYLDGARGKYGALCEKRTAFCLETQHFPNAINQPEFASTLLKAGETYNEVTVYAFSK